MSDQVTVLIYDGDSMFSHFVQWGERVPVGSGPSHVAYLLPGDAPAASWTISPDQRGIIALPLEQMGLPAQSWPVPATPAETAAWVAALRAEVGQPYGWNTIALDLLDRFDDRLARVVVAHGRFGPVCSSLGAITLWRAAPDRYRAIFGDLLPVLVEPVHWRQAAQAALVPTPVPLAPSPA